MKAILHYLRGYFYELDKRVLGLVTIFTALLIYFNYYSGWDDAIDNMPAAISRFFARYLVFLAAFGLPWALYLLFGLKIREQKRSFFVALFLAPAIFAFKVVFDPVIPFSGVPSINNYWNHIIYWPTLLLVTLCLIMLFSKLLGYRNVLFGTTTRGMQWKPYWMMLLIMVPLVAAASTQPDFLRVYPKLQLVSDIGNYAQLSTWKKILFELSYGSDFVTIELFFRGLLVIAFIRWGGSRAILPMACFYCTIHFGKPLGECISSYFGGMILGIVVYNTRSAWGGLLVHLGIAWMMEAGGYFGNALLN